MARLKKILVQGSSRSWSGGPDRTVSTVQGKPAIQLTLEKLRMIHPFVPMTVIAPEFDRDGLLSDIVRRIPNCTVSYSHDSSPFDRIYTQVSNETEGWVLRIDGLNFCFLPEHMELALQKALSTGADVVKFKDDFPAQLAFEIYQIRAIQGLKKKFEQGQISPEFRIQSKFAYYLFPEEFKIEFLQVPNLSKPQLQKIRETMAPLYNVDRIEVGKAYIAHGDQIRFHYEKAKDWITPQDSVLDIACGDGFGVRILAQKAGRVMGGDIDPEVIAIAQKNPENPANVGFQITDVTKMSFPDQSFDVVTSMETIEHLKPLLDKYLSEIHRVLKPGGRFILSTPQNALGEVPITAAHNIEFSYQELVNVTKSRFSLNESIGIKAGCIYFKNDPIGNNTMLCLTKI